MGSFDAGYGSSHMARIVGQKKARGDYTNKIKTKREKKKKNQSSHFVRILEQIETCGCPPPPQTKKRKKILAYINSQVKFIILTETWFLCRL